MYWIEICTDGSYVIGGQESPSAEGIEKHESYDGERSGNDWAFRDRNRAWRFCLGSGAHQSIWSERSPASWATESHRDHVLLKDEVMFRIQDGWAYPKEPTLDLKPRVTKMRLV